MAHCIISAKSASDGGATKQVPAVPVPATKYLPDTLVHLDLNSRGTQQVKRRQIAFKLNEINLTCKLCVRVCVAFLCMSVCPSARLFVRLLVCLSICSACMPARLL